MELWKPTEAELYDAGTLKWTGMRTEDGEATLGAWVAEMDFGTSPAVSDRLIQAVRQGFLGYPPRWGDAAVTDALVQFQDARFGWVLKDGWVQVAPSILSSFRLTIQALTRPGSAVVVPTPAYMPFLTIPGEFGREAIQVPSLHVKDADSPEDAWSLDLDGIEDALKAGAGLVVLCNPWNPTGRSFSVAELRALHDVVSRYDALVFSDEVHSPLELGDPGSFVSYASLGPSYAAHTVTAVAASKAWNIAGLQCAQVILPDADLRRRYTEARSGWYGHPSALGQVAAIPAYLESTDWLDAVIAQVNANLDLLDEALAGTAVDYARPQATYLTWLGYEDAPRFAGRPSDGGEADAPSPAEVLRDEYRVAVNDGLSLGAGYGNWVRVNAAMSPEPWKKVVAALADLAG